MDKSETVKLFAVIAAMYPRESAFKNATPETIIAWQSMLEDIPFTVAQAALKATAANSPFVPAISEIRQWAMKVMYPEMLGPDEAWGIVRQAISKYGYYQRKKARKSMPPEVWAMVERIGWNDLCTGENAAVDRGQFMKMWNVYLTRQWEKAVLPPAVQALIGKASERMALE